MADRISVCLLSNAAYAAPTAVVAMQIARFEDPAIESINFFWVEENAAPPELIRYLEKWNVNLIHFPGRLLDQLKGLSSGRLPAAAFARMLLAEAVPSKVGVDRFVYLDGDIHVRKALGALAAIHLPQGFIATADGYQDVIPTQSPERRVRWKADMAKLGLHDEDRYFNNGVIVSRFSDWSKIGPAALEFYRNNSAVCPFFDQDALNAICRDSHVTLSPSYNFQRAYFAAGVFDEVDPHIIHFHGKLKPWAPIPLHWTSASRHDFEKSYVEMLELWKLAPPKTNGSFQVLRACVEAWLIDIKDRQRRSSFSISFLHYCNNTKFADGALNFAQN